MTVNEPIYIMVKTIMIWLNDERMSKLGHEQIYLISLIEASNLFFSKMEKYKIDIL